MTLGKQIKQARESKNLSQEELAAKLGVSRQAVSKWENDSSIPQGINREVLSQVLGTELLPSEEKTPGMRQKNWFGWLGWGVATVLFILLVISSVMSVTPRNGTGEYKSEEPLTESSNEKDHSMLDITDNAKTGSEQEVPAVKSITFYDNNQNEVTEEALWYDSAEIDSILVQWEGGTPDNVKMFSTPSGTETMEMTELLLTKSVSDGNSAVLLNADSLNRIFQGHIYFELDFGDNIVRSEIYNVFNYEDMD